MKRLLIVLLLILESLGISSQEVVSTQGDSYSSSNGNIDFTIGEVIINTETNGVNDITQGFHQSKWLFVSLEDHVPDYEVIIYPNPTKERLNIKTSIFENVTYTLYDIQGKVVLQQKLSKNLTSIRVSQLLPGNYSLVLNNTTGLIKTFKLVKTH